jgi:hypothetical protein
MCAAMHVWTPNFTLVVAAFTRGPYWGWLFFAAGPSGPQSSRMDCAVGPFLRCFRQDIDAAPDDALK